MKPLEYYSVTLYYEGNIPNFSGTVPARDKLHAERLVHYDALAKGWPRKDVRAEVIKLKM